MATSEARPPRLRLTAELLRKVAFACADDNILRMGAALAYYTLFSLAPLMLISVAVAGLVFGEKAAQGGIVSQIGGLIGDQAAQAVQTMMASAHKPGKGILSGVIGIVIVVIGATGAFGEIYTALNNIWKTPPAKLSGIWSTIRARLLSFGLVLVIGFLMLASLLVSAMLAGVAKFAGGMMPVPPLLLHAIELVFTTLVLSALFAMIFKILPEARIEWKDVWIGALVTAVMFSGGKFLIGLYIGKSLPASSYGAAGSIVVLISWIYYSALILYIGAEFTQAYAAQHGSHSQISSDSASRRFKRDQTPRPPRLRVHHA